ncbi:YlbF/YmcA family competence regulator [Streptococcus halichoeri]|uniref:YlbF/YmcA family competence regulator n=1 Tax=Streptococcus halichoeri TaxID=254785 RepID=UPI000DB6E747|nr:YlbF/YmcA family competence regulator [Streptococcus halichoeri]PZO96251.1 MAG: YlbF/YmcA family competence regulator [Streptococcus pyogenes]
MSQEIYDHANHLERALRSLPEFKQVEAAKEAIAQNAEADALFSDFVAMQEKIQGLMQSGQTPSADEQAEIQELSQKIEGNTLLKAYFDAQQHLSVYITDIERIVFAPLKDLV